MAVSWSRERTNSQPKETGGYDLGMWIFSVLDFVGLAFAILLRIRETGPKAHGLETITATTPA
jgi:hypothetical protein